MKYNFGCGRQKLAGYVGVDIVEMPTVEIVCDFNIFPYPMADSSAEEILMDNVLEHLNEPMKVLEEVFRILKPGAIVKIFVPNCKSNSAFTDPTHKHFFTENSFKYFEKNNPLNFYTKAKFELVKFNFINDRHETSLKHRLRKFIPGKKILNYFLFNIYDELYFELRCIK